MIINTLNISQLFIYVKYFNDQTDKILSKKQLFKPFHTPFLFSRIKVPDKKNAPSFLFSA